MRTILTTCFLVLLLLWELNAATSLSPSTPSQHGGSAESHMSTSRSEGPTTLITSDDPTKELRPEHGELNDATFLSPSTPSQHGQSAESQRFSSKNGGPTILLRSDQPTTELRPQHGDSSSKKPTHFPTKQNLTDTSHSEHKNTEIQTTREENESPSSTFSLATSKVQTKRSLEYSTESQEPSTDKESTILATRDHNQHSTTGVTSSKQSADTSQALMTSMSHAELKTTKVQITMSESKSPSNASSLITSRRHTKRSLVTSENKQTTSTPAKQNVINTTTAEEEHQTSHEVKKSTENTSIMGNLLMTSMSHPESKTSEIQITTGKSKSPSHSSSLSTLRQHTKRSLLTPENNQTTTTPAKLNVINATTAEKEHQTSQEVHHKSTDNNSITGNLQQTISNSTEKVVSQQTNTTTQLPTTQRVVTDEPVKVSADHQTKVQTTAGSPQAQENGETRVTASTTVAIPNTTKLSKNISEVTSKAQTSGSVLPISTSTTKVTFIPNTSMASTGPSKGSTTGPTTGPKGPSTGSSTGFSSGPSTGPVTDETVTTSVTMVGKTPTAAPTSSLTTQPTKKPTNKKILPVTPETQDQSNAKKNNTGPIVASLIGSALVLMFIAIAVILFRKRRMQKRQLDNPDWAGPSPFLDSDIHPNSSKQGDEELFPTKRDTKRISLHSFLPQRLSQRLSLLVEEDVQMNDMVVNSTFGKNENSQNGKPTVQQGEEQEQDQDQDKSQEQKLTEANTPDVVSLAPGAPETVDKPAAPVDNGTIQPTSTPAEEITSLPSPSTETSAALPTPPPFEDVDLSLPQTNPANTSPAPQT
ncbi:mucin-17 [Astyanax mexicanus]|uniref:mucin-17 n=1 Tax=Astyanax mexicanus TaxID=7994 RepID=UPI0020CACCA2|nr:mucin-17 [Astyanax mexicanus]